MTYARSCGLALAALFLALPLAAPPAQAATSTLTARASGSPAIRSGPGTQYAQVGRLPNGTQVQLAKCTFSSRWCYVLFDQTPGWVRGSYLVGSPAKVAVTPPKLSFEVPFKPGHSNHRHPNRR